MCPRRYGAADAKKNARIGSGRALPRRARYVQVSYGECGLLRGRGLLVVPAELEAHRRREAVAEQRLAARAEARVDRRAQHRRGHRLVDRREQRPTALARIRDAATEILERRALSERRGRQVE